MPTVDIQNVYISPNDSYQRIRTTKEKEQEKYYEQTIRQYRKKLLQVFILGGPAVR